MAEIIKTYKERLPALRMIGKRYTEADRQNGGFGHKWGEWFQSGWFLRLEGLGEAKNIENGYLGFMRCNGCDMENTFEYWVGMFFPPETAVPDGFEYIDLPESDLGVCWIQGKEQGDNIFGMHDQCIEKFRENGLGDFYSDEKNRACFFERYNCPRWTTADEQSRVILDYGMYLK